jgi:site-specific recombinase XerC
MVRRIFGHWAIEANIDPIYSFHALRHGRGVMVWEATKDIEAVRSALRQKTATAALIYTRLSPKLREQYREQLEVLAPNSTFQE